jgi:hypothetical protein
VPQTRQVLRHLQARDPISIPSWGYCHQIDDGEDPDPNDVERVPKWGKAHEPQLYPGAKAHNSDLCHHHEEPDEPASNVQPVAAHKGEEGGEKRAALRGRALSDHAGELADLSGQPSRGAGWWFVTPRGAPLPLSSTAVNQIVQISFPLTSAFSISENPESSEWRFEVFT